MSLVRHKQSRPQCQRASPLGRDPSRGAVSKARNPRIRQLHKRRSLMGVRSKRSDLHAVETDEIIEHRSVTFEPLVLHHPGLSPGAASAWRHRNMPHEHWHDITATAAASGISHIASTSCHNSVRTSSLRLSFPISRPRELGEDSRLN